MLNNFTLDSRLVRYKDLKPCLNAFVDSRTPGSDKKENFTIIGPGVSENPDQHIHIPEAHGFNIGGARQPPGCLNSQHSHLTAEVFVVHSGQWRFMYGVNADDADVKLGPGDTISIPPHMFRGFENIGDSTGFLFAVIGGDDPGKVTWAPSVFELAEKHGLVLLEGGRLIDTTAGAEIPAEAMRQQPPTLEELAELATPSAERLAGCIASADSLSANPDSALNAFAEGEVTESAIITPEETHDGFEAGPIVGWWKHGFNLRCLTLASGSQLKAHTRQEAEVIFLHSGQLSVHLADQKNEKVSLGPGDTLTLPAGAYRAWSNDSEAAAVAYVVRGGNSPAAPVGRV